VVVGALGREFSGNVRFRNPFKMSITVTIKMIGNDDKVFELLIQKKKNINLSPLTSLEIPFRFKPTSISTYNCKVIITLNENLSWHFPVKGITESKSAIIYDTFKVKSRRKLKREMTLTLPGLVDVTEDE